MKRRNRLNDPIQRRTKDNGQKVFAKGRIKTGGRKKGVPNKLNTAVKEAIWKAAEHVGENGKGKRGAVGFLINLARTEPKTFGTLLGKLITVQVAGEGDGPIHISIDRIDEDV